MKTDDRHHFEITFTSRGAGADWKSEPSTVEVRAYSLNEALLAAAELPLSAWFPDLDADPAPRP